MTKNRIRNWNRTGLLLRFPQILWNWVFLITKKSQDLRRFYGFGHMDQKQDSESESEPNRFDGLQWLPNVINNRKNFPVSFYQTKINRIRNRNRTGLIFFKIFKKELVTWLPNGLINQKKIFRFVSINQKKKDSESKSEPKRFDCLLIFKDIGNNSKKILKFQLKLFMELITLLPNRKINQK